MLFHHSIHAATQSRDSTSSEHAILEVARVSKRYPALPVLESIDFRVERGEFIAIVGPSGCGKSTLLNLIAGLEEPTSGTISLDGDARGRRLGSVGYMHQRDLLMPWRSVVDNAALSLEIRGVSRPEARGRVRDLLPRFGLEKFGDVYPAQLSGGMRQRVALLRAILPRFPLLLLDEPFGALDALTRSAMQEWLGGMLRGSGTTAVLVTHDVEEAVLLADRVYVLTPGPGTVKATVEVTLPRPRSVSIVSKPEFVKFKAKLLELVLAKGDTAR